MRPAYLLLPAALLLLAAGRLAAEPGDLAEDERVLREAKLPTEGPALLDLFRQRTLSEARTARIPQLVKQLASDEFETRKKASAELKALGPPALPLLRRAAAGVTDAEAKNRLRDCIETLEGIPSAEQAIAAARLVRVRKPSGAVAVLLAYLPFADDDVVENEVLLTLVHAGVKDGKVEEPVAAALTDAEPVRRAAAALVLGRYGTKDQQATVRKLLADPEPRIRLRAAQGLLAARDKSSVPVLLELLDKAPPITAQQAEDLLGRLAGDTAPATSLVEEAKERQKCVAAWQAWWKTNESKLDLAKADVELTSVNADVLAKTVSTQFFQAAIDRNADRLLKVVDVPFSMMGIQTFKTKEEFVKLVAGAGPNPARPKLKAIRTMTVEEYSKKVPPESQEFVKFVKQNRGKLVYMQFEENGHSEGAVLLVRITGGKARVIGLGTARDDK